MAVVAKAKRKYVRVVRVDNSLRDAEIAHLYSNNKLSLREIGDCYGITGARAQQIVSRAKARAAQGVDAISVLKAARSPTCTGFRTVCELTGISDDAARRCLLELGCWPAVYRLWRWRRKTRKGYSRPELIQKLQSLSQRLGRVPGINDMIAAIGMPSHTVFYRRFGSFRAAQEAAGFKPRDRGSPGWTEDQRSQYSARRRALQVVT